MKQIILLIAIAVFISSCDTTKHATSTNYATNPYIDTPITQSLFNDKASTISEENIQKILDGNYKLPQQLRVALVKLENPQAKRYYWSYWSDEEYLKTQQSYLDLFSEKLKQSPRITKLSIVPDLLISKSPSFTSIREIAVRMQADLVVVYSINGDIYSKYKIFSKPDIKAFATTQLIILDVRTGLVPFSTMATKDFLAQKKKDELDQAEARNRIQHEAVLLTINEIGEKVTEFLKSN